jgi:hypothetical protein
MQFVYCGGTYFTRSSSGRWRIGIAKYKCIAVTGRRTNANAYANTYHHRHGDPHANPYYYN